MPDYGILSGENHTRNFYPNPLWGAILSAPESTCKILPTIRGEGLGGKGHSEPSCGGYQNRTVGSEIITVAQQKCCNIQTLQDFLRLFSDFYRSR